MMPSLPYRFLAPECDLSLFDIDRTCMVVWYKPMPAGRAIAEIGDAITNYEYISSAYVL